MTTLLSQIIAEKIRKGGAITVADFMETALMHPAHGYYQTRDPFGVDGDFITAPEISQMFGEMIGAWIASCAAKDFALIELGPGRGTLMADILRTLKRKDIPVHLVEGSRVLKDIQAKTLKGHNVTWHDRLEDVPGGTAFIIANEFFDALPIHQLKKMQGQWYEIRVGKGFVPELSTTPVTAPESFSDAPDGSIFEISLASLGVMQEISGRVAKDGGGALIIDYGHETSGLGETLQAVKAHKFVSPFEDVGNADITAHVDFGALKAASAGTEVFGPVTQRDFLRALGIETRADMLCGRNLENSADIQSQLDRLIGEGAMGNLFKVMAVTAKGSHNPAGF